MKHAVFILSLFDTGYYAARAVKKEAEFIYGFDHDPDNPGFYSRHIKSFQVPHPQKDPVRLFEILQEKRSECPENPVLIATSEVYLDFMWIFRKKLEQHFLFLLPDQEVLGNILNKSTQFNIAAAISLNISPFRIINKSEDLIGITQILRFPMIIKGVDQANWKLKIKEKAFIVKDSTELSGVAEYLHNQEIGFILQELIIGGIYNNFEFNALVENGKIIMHQVVQKLQQYPLGFGAACCLKTVDNKSIEQLGTKFVEKNAINGLSNTEFKYEETSGKFYFIETNARVWQQIELANNVKDSFIVNYFNLLVNNRMTVGLKSRKDLFWVDFPTYLLLFLKYRHLIKLTISEFLRTTLRAKRYGLFNIFDLKPFLKDLKIIR